MQEAAFLVVIFAVAAISGLTAAVVGFGIGSLLTPLLVTRFDPALAVGVVALPHLVATAIRFAQHRRWIDGGVLRRFGVPSAVGALAGALLQTLLAPSGLLVLLGGLLVLTGIANLTRGFGEWRPSPRIAIVLGFGTGLFGGLAGNQGGLRAAGLTTFNLPPRAFLATGTAVALLIDAARTPVYVVRGGAELAGLATIIGIATAGCVAGTIAGERVFLRLAARTYRMVIGVAVLALGIWLIASA